MSEEQGRATGFIPEMKETGWGGPQALRQAGINRSRSVRSGSVQAEMAGKRTVTAPFTKSAFRPLPWFLAAAAAFLYLNLFRFPNTPFWLGGDNSVYLLNATRMLDGQVMYRDFYHFVPPGAELVYIAFLKVFGMRAFVPNLALIAVGTALTWVITTIAIKVLPGKSAYLPALVFLTFEYRRAFDGFHHWLSLLAIMAAIQAVMEARTGARLALFGALCGIASCFTQTYGPAAMLGLALFMLWEKRNHGNSWGEFIKLGASMAGPFLAVTLIAIAYFSREVGLANYYESTVAFLIHYYPKDLQWNTFRVYMSEPPEFLPWYRLPALGVYLFIPALLPLVYIIFIIRHWRLKSVRPQEPWSKLMLLNFMGLALLASAAPAPDWVRMCAASLPGLIILAWHLQEPGKLSRAMTGALWAAILLLALAEPIERQTHWHASLDFPMGRAALMTPDESGKFDWLFHRTRPGDYLFEASFPDVYFLLGLRNPAKSSFLTPTDYTRPEQVEEAISALEKHHVKFVIWRVQLDMPYENRTAGDHLGPLREYLHRHYKVATTFSTEQI